MSENKKDNVSVNNTKNSIWPLAVTAGISFACMIGFIVCMYRMSDTEKPNAVNIDNNAIQTELTEQMYILEMHKLNDIRNELRRANELKELQLKQDSVRTELARRQYMLDSSRFAVQQRKR